MTEDELQQIATRIADQIELRMRRDGTWPNTDHHLTWPIAPQWWQPGGSPTCLTGTSSAYRPDGGFTS